MKSNVKLVLLVAAGVFVGLITAVIAIATYMHNQTF